jgi:hypothetical protein
MKGRKGDVHPALRAWSKDFKKSLQEAIKGWATIAQYNIGYFYVSGFIKTNDGRYYYFATKDLRFYPSSDTILFRTAKDDKDYQGGFNNYVRRDHLAEDMKTIVLRDGPMEYDKLPLTTKVCSKCHKDYADPYSYNDKVDGWSAVSTGTCPSCRKAEIEGIIGKGIPITRTSMFSGKTRTIVMPITQQQLSEWENGTKIQDAMPHLSPSQREYIMTGVTKEEWDAQFGTCPKVDVCRHMREGRPVRQHRRRK